MASRLLAYVGALLVVSLSSACSGSSGDPPPPQGLAKGSFVKDAYTLTLGGWGGHFADFVPYVRIQQLYSGTSGVAANAIGASGFITAVEFFSSDTAASYTCPSIALKMGHTSLDALGTTFATNVEQGKGTLATVRTAKPFTVPAVTPGAGVKLTLDTPFYFNGFDNVVVEFIRD